MSVKKFKFISPSIQVAEIDNSQLPKVPRRVGPCIIGKFPRGPAMRPTEVQSFSDFVTLFGNPQPGGSGQGGDVWRDGNSMYPSYAAYAAQAYLKNSNPVTIVRLLGHQHTDATTAGQAGWVTKDSSGTATTLGITDASGGAYGLFLIDSGSSDKTNAINTNPSTGSLAAIWYFNQGSITLSGSERNDDGVTTSTGSAMLVKTLGANHELRAELKDYAGNTITTTTFNFNINSKKYIRRVFNTNPALTNTNTTTAANTASYWLGQTYERHVDTYVTGGSGQVYGIIFGLKGQASTDEGSDFRMNAQASQTGWFFSQDLNVVGGVANSYQPENQTKLFKFHCLDSGEGTQKMAKISIQDIRSSNNPADPYGTFTVVLRHVSDHDGAIRVLERYTGCNLNPNSANYVAKKIGDRYITWDDFERRTREYGNYRNASAFVRIEMNTDVEAAATDPELLPFGVFGPVRHKGFALAGGENQFQSYGSSVAGNDITTFFVKGGSDIVRSSAAGSAVASTGSAYTGSFLFPAPALRVSASDGNLGNPKDAYWGLITTTANNSTRFDRSYYDMIKPLPSGYSSFAAAGGETEHCWAFTLDDISGSGVAGVYNSGSRAAGTSLTATSSNNYREILNQGFNRFTAPLFGGFDGLDITEKYAFNNRVLTNQTQESSYEFNSIKRAIDSVADPEIVEMNALTMPGLTHAGLTSHILNLCEERGDALGIIDLEGGFIPSTENANGDSAIANAGDVDTTVTNLEDRGLNTSYGCCYYPWVQIVDQIQGTSLWAPPSVVALGVFANSERKSELWFAPAGFNRGGLSDGNAGIPVTGVRERLSSKERDKLYQVNINPIAQFPAEGIVVYGQKTLQITPSALDRINVRRLLIYLKKEISRMAATVHFDPNVRATWNRFKSKAEPFLKSVKSRFGLTDFKLILDETTTTPDLIDRNVMYAKILLKPTRTIEFIAIDFVIARTGASFDD